MNLYFATNEGHKCDKLSMKNAKSFDDANGRQKDIVF